MKTLIWPADWVVSAKLPQSWRPRPTPKRRRKKVNSLLYVAVLALYENTLDFKRVRYNAYIVGSSNGSVA